MFFFLHLSASKTDVLKNSWSVHYTLVLCGIGSTYLDTFFYYFVLNYVAKLQPHQGR